MYLKYIFINIKNLIVIVMFSLNFQGEAKKTDYPGWVLGIAGIIILAGIAPIPIVYILRRFQLVKLDVDIHQGSIRRIDTTVSTKEMMGDVDVSTTYYWDRRHFYMYLHVEIQLVTLEVV